MHNDDKSKILGDWLDGKLSDQQRDEFEQFCAEDAEFAKRVESANQMMMEADGFEQQNVPNWDRSGTFDAPEKQSWWNWQGLPALSFCTSFFAIAMVVSGFEVTTTDGKVTMGFASTQSTEEIAMLVDQKISEYQQGQQQALNVFAQTMQQQQLDASTKLTEYLLTSSRQERREDFAELIKFVNEQRSDDQLFYARQINKLQQDIYGSSNTQSWPPATVDETIQNEE